MPTQFAATIDPVTLGPASDGPEAVREARQEAAAVATGRGLGLAPIDCFTGDFDLLPIAAHLRYGDVPAWASSEDFQNAAVRVSSDLDTYAEAHWHIEAVRWRRANGGRPLDEGLREIAQATARRLYERDHGSERAFAHGVRR